MKVERNGERQVLKTGLYTSPHLMEVRERIRINGQPISKETFAENFFEIWDRLERNKVFESGRGCGLNWARI